jgi:putative membrane protein
MWYWGEGMGWWMLFGGFWMVLFWGAIVALIVWGISRFTRRADSGTSTSEKTTPLDIAKERYAKGEISKEEYEQLKKDIA